MNSWNISNNEKTKQAKLNAELGNIKSDYFLPNLFEHIEKNISLRIMRYNKQLQKRFNLTIKDYKYYSECIRNWTKICR